MVPNSPIGIAARHVPAGNLRGSVICPLIAYNKSACSREVSLAWYQIIGIVLLSHLRDENGPAQLCSLCLSYRVEQCKLLVSNLDPLLLRGGLVHLKFIYLLMAMNMCNLGRPCRASSVGPFNPQGFLKTAV